MGGGQKVYVEKVYVLFSAPDRWSGESQSYRGSARIQSGDCNRGGVKKRNKGGCKRLFAHVFFAFSPLRLLAFVCVCLRLFAFARIGLRPALLHPPLRDTDTKIFFLCFFGCCFAHLPVVKKFVRFWFA